ncbi:MAG: hypothetical protein N4A46_05110 [Schleiferiaceae bacterium]|jgi:predicted small lipoprotein YifL|nr:hypothetical protein [Schleiferiaceae bacterium]
MKNIFKVFLVVFAVGVLASCGAHEKCPTYSGELEVEKPVDA